MHILFVDDDVQLREIYARVLGASANVVTAASMSAAMSALLRQRFDAVITDLQLRWDDHDGLTLLEAVLTCWPSTRRILMTGASLDFADRHVRALAQVVLRKPFSPDHLRDALGIPKDEH